MKKRGLLVLLSLFLILSAFVFIQAETNSTTEQQKVDKAYSCLTDKVSGKCATLSTEEKIFSVLSVGQCSSELQSASSNSGECWPSSSCNIKTTAQALLALDKTGSNVKAQNWLLSKNVTPTELTWYLEIEADNITSCSIKYSGLSYNVNIDENKKINSNAGSCLILAQDNYWLRISPSCYDRNFSVSCDQSFLTTLLFKKSTSSTINVLEKTSSAAASGTTTEKVESSCFSTGTSCDYEGSLWASLVLDSQGKDISSYLPYLITMVNENERFLPEAFLYAVTANPEYKISLLSKQKSNQWWMESGDKFYDTALALYPLQQESSQEKTNAKEWLLTSQDTNGCWQGNIRNTGFILASIWPKQSGGTGIEIPDCETKGYYCTNSAACDGQILSEFSCPGSLQKCCTTQPKVETCSQVGGSICNANERCIGGTVVDASDLRSQEICCAQGSCNPASETVVSECESNNGICRLGSCDSNEQESFYSCQISSDLCCVQKTPTTSGKSYLWIWILIILIILAVIAIIFRNSLRILWFRISSSGKGPRPGPSGPSYPSMGYRRPPERIIERRILVPQQPARRMPTRPSGAQRELDDVLKKLKDMGK
jgi:hypothetical protein